MSIANEKIINLQDAKVLYDDLRGRIEDNSVAKVLDTPADVQSFSDAARFPMELKVGIDPVQDLHGYDYPWVGGTGKNLYCCMREGRTTNGITFTNINGEIYVSGTVSGTNTAYYGSNAGATESNCQLFSAGTYTVSGSIDGASLMVRNLTDTIVSCVGDGNSVSFTLDNEDYIWVQVAVPVGTSFTETVKLLIQIESGSTATEYAPYSNLCPITGWTGANVTVTGKNLWSGFIAGKYWTVDGTETTRSENTYAGTNKFRITGNMNFKLFSDTLSNGTIAMMCFDENDGFIEEVVVSSSSTTTKDLNVPLTLPSGTEYVAFRAYRSSVNGGVSAYITAQIMLSYEEASEYEAYKGTVYPITFPTSAGTVYGGELTIHSDGSGELVVDRAFFEFDGSEDEQIAIGTYGGSNKYVSFTLPGEIYKNRIEASSISNAYLEKEISGTNTNIGFAVNNHRQIRCRYELDNSITVEIARAYFASNPVQFVVPLQDNSVTSYVLTPGQVFAILGHNNVWADCGQINHLEYVRDTVGEVIPNRFDGIDKELHTYEKSITESSAIQSFDDGTNWAMGLNVAVDPVQDLHGYGNPWPGGGGKNLFPLKAKNSYTSHGITFTPKVDDDGNVISIIVNGTNDGAASSVYDTVTGGVPTASARQTDIDFSKSYLFTGAQSENIALNLWAYDSDGTYIYGYYNRSTSATTINNSNIVSYVPIIEIRNGVTVNNVEITPMLRLATEADATFEPYSNVCPITGWTGANVTVTGKNLYKFKKAGRTQYGIVYTLLDDGKMHVVGTATDNSWSHSDSAISQEHMTLLPAGDYILKKSGINGIRYYGRKLENGVVINLGYSTENTDAVFTLDEPTYIFVNIRVTSGTTIDADIFPQIECGSTASDYATPNYKEYSISFPTSAGTVYGGTLTVNKDGTGTLVVDKEYKTFDGSENWEAVSITGGYWMKLTDASINCISYSASEIPDVISNMYISKSRTEASQKNTGIAITKGIAYVYDPNYQTNAAFKTFLSNNNLTVVYPLATPITYTLTAPQVLSLIGKNNVWADTGDILSLTYNSKQGMEFIREDTAGQIRAMMPEPQEEKRIFYATCDTEGGTQEKVCTIEGLTELKIGDIFIITFVNSHTYNGAPTLNINGFGAKTIRRTNSANAVRYQWNVGQTLTFVYDGTYMQTVNNGIATTTYYGLTKLSSSITSTSSGTALTPAGINAFSQHLVTGVGLYDATATYSVGDRMRYSYNVYECTTPIETPEALNLDHWRVLPALQTQIDNAENGMAIMISGDVAPRVIYEGKYVYLKNHSTLPSGLYHTTAYIYAGGNISSSNVVADSDGGFNVLNDFLTVKKLTVTRTENNYCTSSDLIGINAYKTGNVLVLCGTFRTSGANGGVISANTEIASITGWSAQHEIKVNVPYLADGSKILGVTITSDGKVEIASATGVPNNMFAYFTACIPAK